MRIIIQYDSDNGSARPDRPWQRLLHWEFKFHEWNVGGALGRRQLQDGAGSVSDRRERGSPLPHGRGFVNLGGRGPEAPPTPRNSRIVEPGTWNVERHERERVQR